MKNLHLVLLVIFLVPFPFRLAAGNEEDQVRADMRGKQEICLGTGISPGRYAFGYNHSNPFDLGSISGLYDMSSYYEKEYISGEWSLVYAYNFTELLAVQGSLAFESGWSDIRGRNDSVLLRKSTDIYLTAIAALRVSWFNRRYVRMYSSAGAGITYNSLSEKRGDGSSPYASRELKAAWQIAPFGVIFGKTLFGFAEIGIGTCYAGCSVGIGYRF